MKTIENIENIKGGNAAEFIEIMNSIDPVTSKKLFQILAELDPEYTETDNVHAIFMECFRRLQAA